MTQPAATAELPVAQPPAERRSRAALVALIACAVVVAGMTVAAYALPPAGDPGAVRWWPFVVVGACVGLIIVLIAVCRLHAFLALVLAALSAGMMSPVGAFAGMAKPLKDADVFTLSNIHWVAAVQVTAIEFGKTAGGIGIVVGLAAVIGICLLESGSADKIVRRFLAAFGEKRAGFALLLAAYVVSIPIFFDTLFMLLVPIAQALWLRTKKDYMLFVMVICCAGVITHSMAIPHPGPLAMLDKLNSPRQAVEVGFAVAMGLATGFVVLMVGWFVCLWANRFTPAEPPAGMVNPEVTASLDRPESDLPSLLAAVTPVILPVLLISGAEFIKAFTPKSVADQPWAQVTLGWLTFLGERHVALLVGAAIAVVVLMRQRKFGLAKVAQVMGGPIETAGVIILITAAGGAFGAMLRNTGVRDAIRDATGGAAINLVLLGWATAVVLRIAQGSATVAMLTTAGIIAPLMQEQIAKGVLPYHPVYLFLAIGYGAFCCSWMNDSGFWVVSRLGGLTERQTLRSWTVLQTVDSCAGLAVTYALATLVPMKLAPAAATAAVAALTGT